MPSQPDKKKAVSCAYSKASYSSQPDKKKAASKAAYISRPEYKKAASRAYSKARYSIEPGKKSLLNVHVTLLKYVPFMHFKGINMHCLNPSLLQGRPISRTPAKQS